MPLALALMAILALLAYILSGTVMMKAFMLFTGVVALAIATIGSKLCVSWGKEGKSGNDMSVLSAVAGMIAFCSWTWVIVCFSYFMWWA